ncbi:MAG: acyl-CoA dehydrogenase, partial [Woeseiaceae bacterium]|nr:acyl-CoA dehydrogenase [Woeseiaceae bacterium]
MTTYTAPTDDIKFLIDDVLDYYGHYKKYPSYEEATPDMVEMIITECARFCETELAPLNQSGDKEGC